MHQSKNILFGDGLSPKWTYGHLQDICAFGLAWTSVAAALAHGMGVGNPLWIVLGSGLLLLGGFYMSGRVRSLKEMDSHLLDMMVRVKVPMIAGILAVGTTFFLTLLFVRSPFVSWLALAYPACVLQLTLCTLLISPRVYLALCANSLFLLGLTLCLDTAAAYAAFGLGMLFLGGFLLAHFLLVRTMFTLFKGRANLRDYGVICVGLVLLVLVGVGSGWLIAPDMESRWDLSRLAKGQRGQFILEIEGSEFDWEKFLKSAEIPPEEEIEEPLEGEGQDIVIQTPSLENLVNLFRGIKNLLKNHYDRILTAALGALIVGVTLWFAWKRWKKRRPEDPSVMEQAARRLLSAIRRKPGKTEGPPPLDPREAVIWYYGKLRGGIGEYGYKPMPQLTPTEFAQFMDFRIPDQRDAIDDLTESFHEARYSPHPIGVDLSRRAARHYQSFIRYLKRRSEKRG